MTKLLTGLLVALLGGPLFAATLELDVPPASGEKYKSAQFRLWLPDDVGHIRALIIKQHGCGRNGIDHADDAQWQTLARKHEAALLGSHFVQDQQCADWFDPANGSDRALATALKDFAERSRHPELTSVPWAIWGHSGGGLWAMGMADRHPERIIAIFARSGTLPEVGPAVRSIPILLQYGEQEKSGRFAKVHEKATEALSTHRPHGALWAPAVDPKSSHDCRQSRHLAIPFFDTLLSIRLPSGEGKEAGAEQHLSELNAAEAWLANPETLEIAPAEKYAGNQAQAGWLPNERIAKLWQEFCRAGEVADRTPPEPPAELRLERTRDLVRLRFSPQADLESGLKAIHVYRDGKRVATLGGEKTKANAQGQWQIWNYGDEPEPLAGATDYVERPAPESAEYYVTAENHAGLESSPSDQVRLSNQTPASRPLFTQSLDGWTVVAEKPVGENHWSIENGVLKAANGSTWLRSDKPYGDFVLRLEWKLPPGGNSGVFLRVPELKAGEHPWTHGMEVQILDDFGREYVGKLKPWQWSGSVYTAIPAQPARQRGPNRWNQYEITCRGDLVRIVMNGKVVAEGNMSENAELKSRPRQGYLGLQNHGSPVEFRNVEILELP
jgi:pimeloyl-ACP methyl ester carboxylesterase